MSTRPVQNGAVTHVIGLDLSLTGTGIVVRDLNGLTNESKRVGYTLPARAPERIRVERLMEIRNEVLKMIQEWNAVAVGIERYAYGAIGRQIDLAELHGVLKAGLVDDGYLQWEYVGIQSARKAAIGRGSGFAKGAVGKKEVMTLCQQASGIEFETTDEADAWAVSEFVRLKYLKKHALNEV